MHMLFNFHNKLFFPNYAHHEFEYFGMTNKH